jgi:hypothetical protein
MVSSPIQIQLVAILAISILMFVLLGLFTVKRFILLLKASHPQIWQSLERPGGLAEPQNAWPALGIFILQRRYREAGDPLLTKMGNSLFGSAYVIAMDLVLLVGALFLGAIR